MKPPSAGIKSRRYQATPKSESGAMSGLAQARPWSEKISFLNSRAPKPPRIPITAARISVSVAGVSFK